MADLLSLLFAGTAGSVPQRTRGLPAFLVRHGSRRLLFDCGEGTQRQLLQSVGLVDLDAIHLTHFHADHWLGLPGLLTTYKLRGREKELVLYGPPGTRDLIAKLRFVLGTLPYPFDVVELEAGDELDYDDLTIGCFNARHRSTAFGYVLREPDRPGRFDPVEAERRGVRPGPDFGRLMAGEEVGGVRPEEVVGPPRRGRKVVLSGDTAPTETLVAEAAGADLLVHEATFCDADRARAAETGHSTATQAATAAREAGVRMLALTHLSGRYAPSQVRDEARAVFPDTVLPRDFDVVDLPLPDRGAPALHRWDADRHEEQQAAWASA